MHTVVHRNGPAAELVGKRCEPVIVLGMQSDIAARLADRASVVARLDLRQRLDLGCIEVGKLAQQRGALPAGHLSPRAVERRPRGAHGAIDLLRAPIRHFPPGLARRRVDARSNLGTDPLATDIETVKAERHGHDSESLVQVGHLISPEERRGARAQRAAAGFMTSSSTVRDSASGQPSLLMGPKRAVGRYKVPVCGSIAPVRVPICVRSCSRT